MGYVAVSGGREAIATSLDLLELSRVRSGRSLPVASIEESLPELVAQVESESSLWAPEIAACALKQARGSVEEAVFLVRAFRSTLERLYVSRVIDTGDMIPERRISAAFKDVPGGQILGATRDYSHRLIDFGLADESDEDAARLRDEIEGELRRRAAGLSEDAAGDEARNDDGSLRLPKVIDYLESIGLLKRHDEGDPEPGDVTKAPLSFPAPRSVRLQALSRGLTQAVIAIGYAAIRGFGISHPTVGELRHGRVPVTIDGPAQTGDADEDAYYLGSIEVCEVESLVMGDAGDDGGDDGEDRHTALDVGYGLVFGGDESKAIAMSVLDHSLSQDNAKYPTQDQEFVLMHIDGVEATGFISHLKLPHYITFQSKLDSVLRSRRAHGKSGMKGGDAHAQVL